MTLPVDPEQLKLRPRPEPDPAVLAVVAAALQLTWSGRAPADGPAPPQNLWRFSGRWWHKPVPLRRDRPRARR